MEYEIEEIESAWQEPGKRYFLVRSRDNKLFQLCYNELDKEWSLVKVVRGGKMLKKVLKILEDDARTPVKEIATMTGASSAEVAKIIKKAEDDRVILKYKTVINWDKLEDEQVWAIIEVKVAPEPDAGFDSVAERISLFPQVRSAYLASGNYDLLLVVVDKSEHEIGEFISEKLSHIEGVQGTMTHFVMKRYKEDGEILEGEEGVKRQPVIL